MAKNRFLAAFVLTFCEPLHGAGFAVFTHGADALGKGLATVAHGNNPEVIFYNPALINRLEGTQIESGVTFIAPMRGLHSNRVNATAETEGEVFFPGTLYVTREYNHKPSVGVGVFSPFGLGTEWGADWEGRYITTRADLRTLSFNPVASFQLSASTSFAAGPDFLLVDAALENKLNFSALGLPDGNQKFSGTGYGVGFNLGVYSELTQTIAIGISYRSAIEVEIDGDAEFDLPAPVLRSAFPNTRGQTEITFPGQLHAAIAYSGIDRLTLEAGVRWEEWSRFDELRIELEQPVNGATTSVSPRNWHNTLTLTTGARYQLNDRLALLAGFVWGEDPIPDETFDPIITDSSHYAVTFGTEIRIRSHRLSVAYSFQKWDDRAKNNDVGAIFSGGAVPDARANGEYEASSHFLALSFTYAF